MTKALALQQLIDALAAASPHIRRKGDPQPALKPGSQRYHAAVRIFGQQFVDDLITGRKSDNKELKVDPQLAAFARIFGVRT